MQCNRITIHDVWSSRTCEHNRSAYGVLLQYIRCMEKIRKDKSLTIRLTNEARQMLNELAQADDRSAASWLEITIRRAHDALTSPASSPGKPKQK